MTIRIEDLRTYRIFLREFRESDVWEGSDAQQVAEIVQYPKFQGFYTFPPKGSSEEEFRKAAIAVVAIAKAVKLSKPEARALGGLGTHVTDKGLDDIGKSVACALQDVGIPAADKGLKKTVSSVIQET
jgi:hypothetical protein